MASIHRVTSRVFSAVPFWDFMELVGEPRSKPTQLFNPYVCYPRSWDHIWTIFMKELLQNTIINLSIFLSFFAALFSWLLKIYYHIKYNFLVDENLSRNELTKEKEPTINLYQLFELFAPIFIRNKEIEAKDKKIKILAGRIVRVILIFYLCLIYFFIGVNL